MHAKLDTFFCELFEGLDRHRLVGRYLPCGYVGDVVVFAVHGASGEAAEHGQLADVAECVGDGALDEPLDGGFDFPTGGQKGVERAEGLEEALLLQFQTEGWEVCQRSLPRAAEKDQSSRSPMWARIWTGMRPAPAKPAK